MKRLTLILIAVILCWGTAAAEIDYGMRMGLNMGNIAMDPEFDEWGPPDADNKMRIGFYGGVWAKYMINEKMSILSGLTYIQKGDMYTIDGDPDIDWIFWGNALEMPVLFSYMVSEAFEVYGGPVLGYMMRAGYRQQAKGGDDNMTEFMGMELGDFINRFELSMAAGVKYHFAEKYFAELGYEYGFTSMIDDDFFPEAVDFMTRTLFLGVGFSL